MKLNEKGDEAYNSANHSRKSSLDFAIKVQSSAPRPKTSKEMDLTANNTIEEEEIL